ncbi:maternal g10 transcript [Diaporthe sp. PMI_573]|nr:maternal g10 transcript [Diaporthaceae sp. PMI_573]
MRLKAQAIHDTEEDLPIFSNKMKDAQNTQTDNILKHQAQRPISEISHQRSRHTYGLYNEKEATSKKLYDWLKEWLCGRCAARDASRQGRVVFPRLVFVQERKPSHNMCQLWMQRMHLK